MHLNVPSPLSFNNIKSTITKSCLYNPVDFLILRCHSPKLPDCNNWLILIIRSALKMLIEFGCILLGSTQYKIRYCLTIYRCYNWQQLDNLEKTCLINVCCVNCGLEHTEKNCSKNPHCITSNKFHRAVFDSAHKSLDSKSSFFRQDYNKEKSHLYIEFQDSNNQTFNQHLGYGFRGVILLWNNFLLLLHHGSPGDTILTHHVGSMGENWPSILAYSCFSVLVLNWKCWFLFCRMSAHLLS